MAVSLASMSDRELLRLYHEQGDPSAREVLVQRHLPLVRSLARRYAGRGESLDDIEQVGAIGLIKAIDRYELSREVALTTYATPNVVGEIKRHFRDKGWAIRVPRALQELNGKMGPTIERLTARLGRSPSIAEIAAEFETSPEQVLEALEAGSAYAPASLSVGPAGGGGDPDPMGTIGSGGGGLAGGGGGGGGAPRPGGRRRPGGTRSSTPPPPPPRSAPPPGGAPRG